MDADTAETVAGVIRLLRRAAELVWTAVDVEGAGSPLQLLALGIDLAADEARLDRARWPANTGYHPSVGGEHRCRRLTYARLPSC
jgi:hypothetical protein